MPPLPAPKLSQVRREEGQLGSALFDGPNREYRLRLDIKMADLNCRQGESVALIGVNPSTADAMTPDQTIRKVQGFAKVHGWREVAMLNLFAWRSTDIRGLALPSDPIGERNDETIFATLQAVDIAIACWGTGYKLPPRLRQRWREVQAIADRAGKNLLCFGHCADGMPLHPLMLSYSRQLMMWRPGEPRFEEVHY